MEFCPYCRHDVSFNDLLNRQLKTIFEMLETLIDDDKYDFSHAHPLFATFKKPSHTTDEYNKLVDANFKSDYPK